MKLISISVLSVLIFLIGCNSNNTSNGSSSPSNSMIETEESKNIDSNNSEEVKLPIMPYRINLNFSPLQLDEVLRGKPLPEWKHIKSIPFGRIENSKAVLDIYEVDESANSHQKNGILKFKDNQILIPNLSASLVENDQYSCREVCVFQKYFSNQNRFELIGSIDVSLNGPGLKTYFIYDEINKKVMSFDLWGEPSFIDLDGDGNDEFIIEFEGLHLSWPDLSVIKTINGELKLSSSVFDTIQKIQGDFAKLKKDMNPIVISLSNVRSENEPIYDYTYKDGILERINSMNDSP
ncbi:hypothetical protein [Cohnella mopanensis]|uniref:hypothetical protein n=1 Tax=Cohnella mopanensis TaxID=2911966 RepID=UPI001EF93345|nr:hypothetical protein [Cohnella mopanensis]